MKLNYKTFCGFKHESRLSSEEQLCNFVNENNIEVVTISQDDYSSTLHYKESK